MISKKIFLTVFITLVSVSFFFGENIYFFTRSGFAVSQFWAGQNLPDWSQISIGETVPVYGEAGYVPVSRKVFANFLSGTIGGGMEMVIWDIGKKRGSRIYFYTGIDAVFSGPTYAGYHNYLDGEAIQDYTMNGLSLHGGAFYTGLDLDLYIGGTFPMTDLKWGIGSIFYFMFPGYANYNKSSDTMSTDNTVGSFGSIFNFYATPSLLIAYDFFIPNTNFKITPQLRTGITCVPFIPNDLLSYNDTHKNQREYYNLEWYSGLYIDFSVSFSFYTLQWKK